MVVFSKCDDVQTNSHDLLSHGLPEASLFRSTLIQIVLRTLLVYYRRILPIAELVVARCLVVAFRKKYGENMKCRPQCWHKDSNMLSDFTP